MSNSSKDLKSLFRQKLGTNSNSCTKHGIMLCKICSHVNETIKSNKLKKHKLRESVSNSQPKKILKTNNLPQDIAKEKKTVSFDSKVEINVVSDSAPIKETDDDEPEKKPNDVCNIPDGFFDDPSLEQKIKKVVPRNKIDEDYDLFMKSIDAVTKENDTILEQESQNDTLKLQIAENINESNIWNSLNNLIDQVEMTRKTCCKNSGIEDDNNNSSDDNFSDDIVWRKKSNC